MLFAQQRRKKINVQVKEQVVEQVLGWEGADNRKGRSRKGLDEKERAKKAYADDLS